MDIRPKLGVLEGKLLAILTERTGRPDLLEAARKLEVFMSGGGVVIVRLLTLLGKEIPIIMGPSRNATKNTLIPRLVLTSSGFFRVGVFNESKVITPVSILDVVIAVATEGVEEVLCSPYCIPEYLVDQALALE